MGDEAIALIVVFCCGLFLGANAAWPLAFLSGRLATRRDEAVELRELRRGQHDDWAKFVRRDDSTWLCQFEGGRFDGHLSTYKGGAPGLLAIWPCDCDDVEQCPTDGIHGADPVKVPLPEGHADLYQLVTAKPPAHPYGIGRARYKEASRA